MASPVDWLTYILIGYFTNVMKIDTNTILMRKKKRRLPLNELFVFIIKNNKLNVRFY